MPDKREKKETRSFQQVSSCEVGCPVQGQLRPEGKRHSQGGRFWKTRGFFV